VRTDPSIPLLPPFPGGAAKLETMRGVLDAEGTADSARARRLLDEYASHEE
jgi:pyruvate dehydrogenase (quinone)